MVSHLPPPHFTSYALLTPRCTSQHSPSLPLTHPSLSHLWDGTRLDILTLLPPAPPPSAVTVSFTVENVTVTESVGQVNICLAVTGRREIPVTVRVTTSTGAGVTATGKSGVFS